MRILYVAGPYSSDVEYQKQSNILELWHLARRIWAIPNCAAICPNANTQHMGGPDINYEKFLEGDFEMIRRADAIVMSPRWKESSGATRERQFALLTDIPVFDLSEDMEGVLSSIEKWAKRPIGARYINIP